MSLLARRLRAKKDYFFLYPVGQTGFDPATFLIVLPFTQVIVVDFFEIGLVAADGVGVGVGVGVASIAFSWVSFTLIVGDENVKFLAESESQPSFSRTKVVAICAVPSEEITEIVAEMGADENP